MGRQVGRHKANFVQPEGLTQLQGTAKVPEVNRVETAAEEANLHGRMGAPVRAAQRKPVMGNSLATGPTSFRNPRPAIPNLAWVAER